MTPGILLDWIKTFPKFGTDQGLRPISVKLRNGGLTTRGDQRGDNLIFLVTFDALFTSYIILSSGWLIVCAGLFFLLFSPEKVSGLSNQGRARLSINIFLLRCLKMGDRLNWTSVWDGRMFRVYMRGRHDYGGDAAKKKKKGGLQAQQEGGGGGWGGKMSGAAQNWIEYSQNLKQLLWLNAPKDIFYSSNSPLVRYILHFGRPEKNVW